MKMTIFNATDDKTQCIWCRVVLAVVLLSYVSFSEANEWQGISSERLVKLPSNYLDRAVEHDFQSSALAQALNDTNSESELKGRTMADIRSALETADDNSAVELQHQYLVEKSAYLDLMENQQQMRKQALNTKLAIYQRLANRLRQEGRAAKDPIMVKVSEQQQQAQERLQANMDNINAVLDAVSPTENSQYAAQYQTNLASLQKLQLAVRIHGANTTPELDGVELSKGEYVQMLVENIEKDMALLDQEQQMLGLMANLVALDAQALEHELTFAVFEDVEMNSRTPTLNQAVDFFVTQSF
jgi:hypothetical protein